MERKKCFEWEELDRPLSSYWYWLSLACLVYSKPISWIMDICTNWSRPPTSMHFSARLVDFSSKSWVRIT